MNCRNTKRLSEPSLYVTSIHASSSMSIAPKEYSSPGESSSRPPNSSGLPLRGVTPRYRMPMRRIGAMPTFMRRSLRYLVSRTVFFPLLSMVYTKVSCFAETRSHLPCRQ